MDVPRAELARLCRQLCVQCESENPRTKSFEEDFLRALAQVQEQFGHDSVNEETLWEIVAHEEQRVADAMVIAELLLPKLSAVMRARLATAPASPPVLNAPTQPGPAATEAAPMARKTSLAVADLIQGMLDQDRNETRRPPSPSRP